MYYNFICYFTFSLVFFIFFAFLFFSRELRECECESNFPYELSWVKARVPFMYAVYSLSLFSFCTWLTAQHHHYTSRYFFSSIQTMHQFLSTETKISIQFSQTCFPSQLWCFSFVAAHFTSHSVCSCSLHYCSWIWFVLFQFSQKKKKE